MRILDVYGSAPCMMCGSIECVGTLIYEFQGRWHHNTFFCKKHRPTYSSHGFTRAGIIPGIHIIVDTEKNHAPANGRMLELKRIK